jgi:hypothetical protein
LKTQLSPEQRKERTELAVKVAGLLGVCLVLGPLATIIASGLGALAALMVGAAGVFTVWKFLPWFALKVGNARLKAIKAEAARNPVETLQTDYQKRMSALEEFRAKIVVFTGEVNGFAEKLKMFGEKYPADVPKFRDQLSKMRSLLELRKTKYQQAMKNLAAYALEIEKADAIWKMGCAAAALTDAAGMTETDFFQKIQVETAMASVQTNLNEAFAELEVSLMDERRSASSEISSNAEPYAEPSQDSRVREMIP